jgi:hypothetical protein
MFKRLTKLKGNYVCWNGNQDYSTRDRYAKVLDRLAAYEDTGLTPAQVEAMKMDMEQLRADNINAEMNLAHMTADKDEQAGRIMQQEMRIEYLIEHCEELEYLLRRTLPILEVANDQQELIEQINELLGGKEDGSSKDE